MKKLLRNHLVLLLFFVSAAAMFVIAIVAGNLMGHSSNMIGHISQEKMVALSRGAAILTTADELDQFNEPEDMELPEYLALKEKIIAFNDASGTEYTYYLRLDTDLNMMRFIIDNTPENFTALAEPPMDREEPCDIALAGTAYAVPVGHYSEGWTGYLTAFAPVYYADGSLSNYIAGVDMPDEYLREAQSNHMMLSLVQACALVLVLGVCLWCMMLYQKKAKQSEVASESKSQFLSRMSHEMRTPMNAIIGMTQIAKSSHDPKRVEYCLGKIDNAAEHLLGVINDVLDISKIESGKFTLTPTDFSLEHMLERVTNVINFKVDEKSQEFVIKVERAVPSSIVADEQRLMQVITNLLSNAVKFTPDGGKIILEVKVVAKGADNCTLQVSVTDNGIGISAKQQEKLFQAFQQADASISNRFGGTGLGLVISKSIVETMGGNIWVESELGKGSCFSFVIKVKTGESSFSNRLAPNVEWSNVRILVVDDEPDVCDYFKEIITGAGVNCDTAESGEVAIDMLSYNPPYTILFIDWRMPGINGIELSRLIREKYGDNIIIIMVSAAQWDEIAHDANSAGVNSFLPKPLFPSTIIDCMNKYVGNVSNGTGFIDNEDAAALNQNLFVGKCILLVEDMDINREILKGLLTDTGVTIDIAENGRIACDKFRASPTQYDLILMDIHMPEMDGYEATGEIRAMGTKQAKEIPIIAMTANVFREDVEKCLAAGMNDHTGKPINVIELIEKLRKYLLL